MKLSSSAYYAVLALLQLSEDKTLRPTPVSVLCERTPMPDHFVRQIMSSLVKKNIAASARGTKGGYWLARPLSKITLLDVVEAVDGFAEVFPDVAATRVMGSKTKALLATLTSQLNSNART